MVQFSVTTDIWTQSQAWVAVQKMLHDKVVLQTGPKLFETHVVACENKIAHVKLENTFWLEIDSIYKRKSQILKDKIVLLARNNLSRLEASSLTAKDNSNEIWACAKLYTQGIQRQSAA